MRLPQISLENFPAQCAKGITTVNGNNRKKQKVGVRVADSVKKLFSAEILKIKEASAAILAKNCGKDYDQVYKDFDRDHWMNAKEALEYGIIDSIAEKV